MEKKVEALIGSTVRKEMLIRRRGLPIPNQSQSFDDDDPAVFSIVSFDESCIINVCDDPVADIAALKIQQRR